MLSKWNRALSLLLALLLTSLLCCSCQPREADNEGGSEEGAESEDENEGEGADNEGTSDEPQTRKPLPVTRALEERCENFTPLNETNKARWSGAKVVDMGPDPVPGHISDLYQRDGKVVAVTSHAGFWSREGDGKWVYAPPGNDTIDMDSAPPVDERGFRKHPLGSSLRGQGLNALGGLPHSKIVFDDGRSYSVRERGDRDQINRPPRMSPHDPFDEDKDFAYLTEGGIEAAGPYGGSSSFLTTTNGEIRGQIWQMAYIDGHLWVLGSFGVAITVIPDVMGSDFFSRDGFILLDTSIHPSLMIPLEKSGLMCLAGKRTWCLDTHRPNDSVAIPWPTPDLEGARSFVRLDDSSVLVGGENSMLLKASSNLAGWHSLVVGPEQPLWAGPVEGGLVVAGATGQVGVVDGEKTTLFDNPWPVAGAEPWLAGAVVDKMVWLGGGAGRLALVTPDKERMQQLSSATIGQWRAFTAHPQGIAYGGSGGRLRVADSEGNELQRRYIGFEKDDALDILDLSVAPGSPDHLWIGTSKGFVVSRDGGASGCPVYQGDGPRPRDAGYASFLTPSTGFVTGRSSLYITRDGGVSFDEIRLRGVFDGPILALDDNLLIAATKYGLGILRIEEATLDVVAPLVDLQQLTVKDNRAVFSGPGGWVELVLQ